VFEIESSLGLFGGWSQFEARLRSELTELGFRHRIVAAPNPVAARMLANAHDGLVVPDDQALRHHLGQLPVDRIGLRPTSPPHCRAWACAPESGAGVASTGLARRFEARCSSTWTPVRFAAACRWRSICRRIVDVRIELNFDVQSHQACCSRCAA
jgi:protein ImuB